MELWAELVDAGCFADGCHRQRIDWTDAADQVANGEAAMNLMGTWITGYCERQRLRAGHRLRLLRVPGHRRGRAERASSGPVDGLVTAAGAANPEAAQALLAFSGQARRPGQRGPSARATCPPTRPPIRRSSTTSSARRIEVAAAAETYNFNYDLATPPAPSEVGLAMFQEFINDSSRTSQALLERRRPQSPPPSRTSSRREPLTCARYVDDGSRRHPGIAPSGTTIDDGRDKDDRVTHDRGSRISLFLMAAGPAGLLRHLRAAAAGPVDRRSRPGSGTG